MKEKFAAGMVNTLEGTGCQKTLGRSQSSPAKAGAKGIYEGGAIETAAEISMIANTAARQHQTAVIYARVSSEEQVRGYSIQAQLRACHEWAEKHGYMVAKEYLEEGQSAFRNLEKRTALKELLADSASKERSFSLIIVHKLDRLFRNTLESATARRSSNAKQCGSSR
jgi:predicted site-specific integrase-resolvase